MTRSPQRDLYMVIATSGDPLPLAAEIEQQVHDLDPDLPVYDMATLEQRLARTVSQPRFSTLLIALFAGLAVTLAAVGLYGLMAWSVSQRTQEIGVRMALGAGRGQVLRQMVGEGARLIAWGLALGLAGALAASRLLAGLLFEIDPTDPWTLIGVTLLLSSVALLASWLPARRAARLDPQIALRRD
jgi:putative ABC transport system permease protein